jgi:hypothetical protein
VEIHSSVVVRLEVSLRVVDIDAIADPVDYKIAEGAVANDVVAWASDTNSLAATVQNAVGHRYSFADRWLFQHGLNGADNDAIIAGLQKAVADGNIPAGVNVDAVIVDHLLVAKHLDTVNEKAGPAPLIPPAPVMAIFSTPDAQIRHFVLPSPANSCLKPSA